MLSDVRVSVLLPRANVFGLSHLFSRSCRQTDRSNQSEWQSDEAEMGRAGKKQKKKVNDEGCLAMKRSKQRHNAIHTYPCTKQGSVSIQNL
jgi:hypothetical protein